MIRKLRTKPILLMGSVAIAFAATIPLRGADQEDPVKLVRGNTAFAIDLYRELKDADGNLFFSPYSISTALAMTWGGARGETEKQMAATLHFPLGQDQLHAAFEALEYHLNEIQKKGEVRLHVANSLWPHERYKFLKAFLDLTKEHYGAKVTPLDYSNTTVAAREINEWVEKKTEDKIKDLISPDALGPLTRLVLVNAIYFKGDWADPFKEDQTSEQPFFVEPGKSVKAPLMHQSERFGYKETDNLQILEMPYAGNDLSVVVLLPKAKDGLAALENSLTAENLEAWTSRMGKREVLVFLPKFTMTSEFSLAETLRAMGITDAFTSKADFSGMDGTRDLFISAVIHKAFVDVDEKGTEAAAATGVVMELAMAPMEPPVFRADHPFLFLIRERKTGSVLFLGRVVNPVPADETASAKDAEPSSKEGVTRAPIM